MRKNGRNVEFGPGAAASTAAVLGVVSWWNPAIPAVLGVLTLLVLLHEGGHLLAARRCGVHASEFFAGFGPVVLAWRTRSGLRVGLKAIPAGGYVKVVGMTHREEVDPHLEAATFRAASRSRRLAVVAAGPAVNLALGLVLLVLASGFDPLPGQGAGAGGAVASGIEATSAVTTGTLSGLADLVTGIDDYAAVVGSPERADEAPARFLSPIGVAQVASDVADRGPWTLVRLVAIISIGLAVMNLLPLPPLDGGHAAVVVVEWLASVLMRRPALHLDSASPVISTLTVVTLAGVLGLGASAVFLDLVSPVRL